MKRNNSLRSLKATWAVLLAALAGGALLHNAYAQPGTNFFENFETGLGNWTQISTTYTNLIWSTAQNKVPAGSGHSAYSLNTAQRMYASSLVPNGLGITAASCKLTYWLYDGSNTRTYAEVRSYVSGYYDGGAYKQLVATGKYGSVTMTGESWDSTKYQGRLANGTPNGWFNLNAPGVPSRSTGWHKFDIERGTDLLGQTVYTFYVDDKVGRVLTNNYESFNYWNSVIMGAGISSSAGSGDSYFDGFQVVSGQSYIFQDPASTTLTVGNPIDLLVQATGDADGPHYQWRKNGQDLAGKTEYYLHIDNAAIADSGSYSVVVSNILAVKTSAVAVVTVNPSLYVTVDPTNALVNPGDTITFTATANGPGSFTYQWKKNGATLSGKTDATLTLSPVANGDAGSYIVTVQNGVDPEATSTAAVLIVNTPPSLPTPADTNAYVGQAFTMRVAATDDFATQAAPFQAFDTNAVGARVTFANPYTSGSTEPYVDGLGRTYVTNVFPAGHGSSQVLYSHFTFTNVNNKNWLRLTTTDGSSSGVLAANPIISFATPLRFDIYTDKALAVGLGLRETASTGPIGSNNGSSSAAIELAGISSSAAPVTSTNVVPAGVWTTMVFKLPDVALTSFNLGNGILDLSTGKGVLEHLALTDGTTPGQTGDYQVWLDNLVCLPTNALSFSLEAAPAGATIDSATGVITWTPAATANALFTVRTTDNMGLSSTASFHVNAVPFTRPNLSLQKNGNNVILTWADASFALQAAPAPTGTYTNVPGAVSGYSTSAGTGALFFRLAR